MLAVFLLLITPGPGVLSLAGVGSAFGRDSGLRYMAGLFVGTNLVALAVVSGLAAVMISAPILRTVFLVISISYLLWLALRIALSGSTIAFIQAQKKPGIIDGIILQAFNPKAYVVNTALFTSFRFANQDSGVWIEIGIKFFIVNVFWIAIHCLWLVAGLKLQSLALQPTTQRKINIAMAMAMVGVVALAALST